MLMHEDALFLLVLSARVTSECIVALLRCTTHLQGPLGTLKLRLQRLSECGKTLLLPTAANLQTGRDSLEDQQS